jgi:hypothetical protein
MQDTLRRPIDIRAYPRVRGAAASSRVSDTWQALEHALLFAVLCVLWAAIILSALQAAG